MSLLINQDKDDSEIVKIILDWDINAFSIIMDRYEKKLLSYISKKTNLSVEDAENLLQDIFIKVYKKLNYYNSSYTFNAWIYKIAYNAILDNYKKKDKWNHVSLDLNIDEEWNNSLLDLIEDKNANIEDNLKKQELNKKIFEIINSLDEKYKEVIILKYMEDLKYEEISDVLKIPYNTVGTLINRAKKQIKQLVEKSDLKKYL